MGEQISPSGGLLVIETLRYYEPVAEWLILLFVAYEVMDKLFPLAEKRQVISRTVQPIWPWIIAGLVVTAIAWGPVVLPYFGAPSGSARPDSAPKAVSSPSTNDEWWVRPHERTVDWRDFHPAWPLDLEHRLMDVTKPCVLKISTVQEHLRLREILVQIATETPPHTPDIPLCTIVDDETDKIPAWRDLDAMPLPSPGLSIHWDTKTQLRGESIAGWFRELGYNVHEGHTLPPKSPPTEIWIDIGPESVWKP